MAKLTSELIVRLIDQVSGPAAKVATGLKGLTNTVGAGGKKFGDGLVRTQQSLERSAEKARLGMVDSVAQAWILKEALTSPIVAAQNLESAMADINKVVDFPTSDGLDQMKRDLLALSLTVPKTAEDLAALTAAAAQAGVELPDLLAFTQMAARVAVAFDMTGDQAGESLAKLRTQLGLTVAETGLYADIINHLSDKMASSAPELVDFAKRVAGVGKGFGFTQEETLAIGSAMISAGAEAEVAATSFRNMGKALAQGLKAPKRRQKAFAQIGLDPEDVQKSFSVAPVETFREVIERLGRLPEWEQMAAAFDIFGEEARGLMPLISNLKLLDESIANVSDMSTVAGSAQREFDNRAKTSANDMVLFGNEVRAMSISLGEALIPALKQTTDQLIPIIRAVKDWIQANPELASTIAKVAVGLVALRLASFGTAWMFGGIASTALKAAINLGKFAAASAAIAFAPLIGGLRGVSGAFKTMSIRRGLAMKELGKSPGILASVGDGFLVFGRMLGRALAPMRLLKGALVGLRVALIGSGIGLAIAGIAMAGMWIWNNWAGLGEMFSAFGDAFMKGIEPLMPLLQPLIDGVKSLLDWISGLIGPLETTNGQWKSWGETLGSGVAAGVMAVANGIRDLIGLFVSAYEKAVALAGAVKSVFSGEGITGGGGHGMSGGGPGKTVQQGGVFYTVPDAKRAVGGRVRAGQSVTVGERGIETFTPDIGGYVTSNKALRGMSGAGGGKASGGVVYAPNIKVDVHGGDASSIERAMRQLADQMRRDFAGLMNGNFADGVA